MSEGNRARVVTAILAGAPPARSHHACRSSTTTINPHAPHERPGPAAPAAVPRPAERPSDQQQLMIRRAIAIGVLVILLIVIVLGFKSCRDNARKNSLRDYNRDVAHDRPGLRHAGLQAAVRPADVQPRTSRRSRSRPRSTSTASWPTSRRSGRATSTCPTR